MNERIEHLEQQASQLWNQRFVVLGVTTVLVSGIIVWVVNASEHWFSLAAEIPVLLVLIAACYITKHVTDSAVRILTYLEVFHEFPAAHPIRRFHGELGKGSSNAGIAWMYLILAFAAGCVFLTLCGTPAFYIPDNAMPGTVIPGNAIAYGHHSQAPKELLTVFVFLPLLGYFIIRVTKLFAELPFEKYRKSWRELRHAATETEAGPADSDRMDE